jgi:hypothetical protein
VEDALKKITGRGWNLRIDATSAGNGAAGPEDQSVEGPANGPGRSRRQRLEALQLPLIKKAIDSLGAQVLDMDEGFGAGAEAAREETGTDQSEES